MRTESSDVPLVDAMLATETPPLVATVELDALPWKSVSSFRLRVFGVIGANELRLPRFGLDAPLELPSFSTVPTYPRREKADGSAGGLGPDRSISQTPHSPSASKAST
jgi:hypothetical protein